MLHPVFEDINRRFSGLRRPVPELPVSPPELDDTTDPDLKAHIEATVETLKTLASQLEVIDRCEWRILRDIWTSYGDPVSYRDAISDLKAGLEEMVK